MMTKPSDSGSKNMLSELQKEIIEEESKLEHPASDSKLLITEEIKE